MAESDRKLKVLRFIRPVILLISICVAALIAVDYHRQRAALMEKIHVNNDITIDEVKAQVEQYFYYLHAIPRIISHCPDVVTMEEGNSEFIQAIYDDHYDDLMLSEIYVVKRDFDGTHQPFMTFEYGEGDETVEETHDLESEEEEYEVLIDMIRRFDADRSIEALTSSPIQLCVEEQGLIYAVPIHSEDELVGIVAAMAPSENISECIERSNSALTTVLCNNRGDIILCETADQSLQTFLEKRFSVESVGELFAKNLELFGPCNPEDDKSSHHLESSSEAEDAQKHTSTHTKPFALGDKTVTVVSLETKDADSWYLVVEIDHNYELVAAGFPHFAVGYLVPVVIVLMGVLGSLLCRNIHKKYIEIEERKKTEKKLEYTNRKLQSLTEKSALMAKEAVKANNTKSDFLANMSHEIRTPMNAILGFSDLLCEEELTGDQKTYVETIRNSGSSLLSIINDILDFSKIEAGKLEVENIDFTLNEILDSINALFTLTASEKGLTFEVIREGDLPEYIRSDPVRLKQCLTNLIGNATKFTDSGYVRMRVSPQQVEGKGHVRFDIEDSGIGITAEKQETIFDSFSQVDSTTTRKYGGTGLGLAITKQLVDLLGGEISLTSDEGKGSVFSVVIPVGIEIGSEPVMPAAADSQINKQASGTENDKGLTGTILVAEDNLTNQMLAKVLLEKLGLTVTIAKDGQEAVELATSQPFDMILMDMQMPKMNGFEATRHLRDHNITTPVIALTANAIKGDREQCLEAGCDDYIAKPIDREKLNTLLGKYMNNQANTADQLDRIKAEVDNLSGLCAKKVRSQVKPG